MEPQNPYQPLQPGQPYPAPAHDPASDQPAGTGYPPASQPTYMPPPSMPYPPSGQPYMPPPSMPYPPSGQPYMPPPSMPYPPSGQPYMPPPSMPYPAPGQPYMGPPSTPYMGQPGMPYIPGQPIPYGVGIANAPNQGMAIAGMILGIVSIVLFCSPFLGWITGGLGITFSAIYLNQAKKATFMVGGQRGMALAGLITGIIGVTIGIILFALNLLLVYNRYR